MSDRRDEQHSDDATGDGASSGLGRRAVLRSAAAIGAGIGLTSSVGVGNLFPAGHRDTSITYAVARAGADDSGSPAPRTKTVPTLWYRTMGVAFDVSRRLHRAVGRVLGSFVRAGGYGEPAAVAIDVGTERARERASDLFADVLRKFSATFEDGVDLDLDLDISVIGRQPLEEDPTDEPYRRVERPTDGTVAGGVACSNDTAVGTLAPAMYDGEENPFFATANHVYGAEGMKRDAHRGESLYLRHKSGKTVIGSVEAGYPDEDLLRARPVEEYEPAARIRVDPPVPVTGQFTEIGLADLQARGEPLEMMGARSGHQVGEIDGVNGLTSYYGDVPKDGQLKWGGRFTIGDGDSGSVNYHTDPENPNEGVLVGGFNDARTWWPGEEYVWGTAAYHLRRRYGYHF
ncbi:hypothetical protein BRC86_00075 [Halobacteriales archaeon QS_3_64_16]|nr:MAG: hypothetical protein BRC86_00075 [Halobacteriales archaeon QS_3_64_16]